MLESPFQGLSPSAALLQPPLYGSPMPVVTAGLRVFACSGWRSGQLWPGPTQVHTAGLKWTPEGELQYLPPQKDPKDDHPLAESIYFSYLKLFVSRKWLLGVTVPLHRRKRRQ